jgi:chaperone required for assembly of F1-ATPase
MTGSGNGNGGKVPIPSRKGRDGLERPLQRRFYAAVAVAMEPRGATVLLDGRALRTPKKRALVVPARALAEAIAGEWSAQGERIDPATMPITRLVNTALDGVADHPAAVRADIVKYAGSDLLCYRAAGPAGLVAAQSTHWDGVLAWAHEVLGARFAVAIGLMPVAQPAEATEAVARSIAGLDILRLAALHVMTTLTGSALLALAHLWECIDLDAAWAAAHVDEDWQISQWGADAEASARHAARRLEMQAASRLLALLGPVNAA